MMEVVVDGHALLSSKILAKTKKQCNIGARIGRFTSATKMYPNINGKLVYKKMIPNQW